MYSGWATKEKKKNWNYRLDLNSVIIEVPTILDCKILEKHERTFQDSGIFNCTTQRGYLNSLQILVTNQICPKIDLHENVIINTTDTFIGTEVSFSCPAGYTLTGTDSIVCRDDSKDS